MAESPPLPDALSSRGSTPIHRLRLKPTNLRPGRAIEWFAAYLLAAAVALGCKTQAITANGLEPDVSIDGLSSPSGVGALLSLPPGTHVFATAKVVGILNPKYSWLAKTGAGATIATGSSSTFNFFVKAPGPTNPVVLSVTGTVSGLGTVTRTATAAVNVATQGCTPTTCPVQNKNCGTIPDGCGSTLNCGGCTAPATCGGGGTPNVCGSPGCSRATSCPSGQNCGTAPDGCGSTINCGTCVSPQVCGGGGLANVCGTPSSSSLTLANIGAAAIQTIAIVSWTTNQAADSQLLYGADAQYGNSSPVDSTQVTAHQVILKGLSSGTLYHYAVQSRDGMGKWVTSADFNFSTASNASTAVAFSPDEELVAIGYSQGQYLFHRPLVTPWNYPVRTKVYWVATNGDDNNPGTQQAPFQTPHKAVSVVGPGDIVYIDEGTYVDNLNILQSGTADSPIIISCAPGKLGKVKITPSAQYVQDVVQRSSGWGAVIDVQTAQYVWINGLVIEGPRGRPEAAGASGFNAITWENGAGNGCQATNNVVYGNNHCGLKELHHGGNHIFVASNVSFANGTSTLDHGVYMPADDTTIDGNIFFDNTGWGIHAYPTPQRLTITRNVSFRNWGGIVLSTTFSKVYNNVSANNANYGILYYGDSATDNTLQNNISAFNQGGRDGFAVDTQVRNVDEYNDYFGGGLASVLPPGDHSHDLSVDPQFVDLAAADFRLKTGSPCAHAGTDVGLPFDGSAPNLGAF